MNGLKSSETRMELIETDSSKIRKLLEAVCKNLLAYVCVALPTIFILSTWFNMSFSAGLRLAYNAPYIVGMIVVGERLTMSLAGDASRKYKNVVDKTQEYINERTKAIQIGTDGLHEFIKEYTKVELERAREAACDSLQIDYSEYKEKYEGKTKKELAKMLGRKDGAKIFAISMIRPLKITNTMLLREGSSKYSRGGISESGDDYLRRKKFGPKELAISILTIVFFAGMYPVAIDGVDKARVLYYGMMLVLMLWRMGRGFAVGVKAFEVVQVESLSNKIVILQEYEKWAENKNAASENSQAA